MKELLFFGVTFGGLFSVLNPFGTMPIFIALTVDNSTAERKKIAFKSSLYVLIVLLISFFIGKYVLLFFGIGITSLRLAGGLIISLSGFALLTGNFNKHKGMNEKVKNDAIKKDDPSLSPLAMPMLAGPGSISFMIGMNDSTSEILKEGVIVLAAISIAISTFLILRSANYLFKKMGASGLNTLSRVIGFLVVAIGIEMMLGSVYEIVEKIKLI